MTNLSPKLKKAELCYIGGVKYVRKNKCDSSRPEVCPEIDGIIEVGIEMGDN